MYLSRYLTAAAAVALIGGAAHAQTAATTAPAAPATPAPAMAATTPMATTATTARVTPSGDIATTLKASGQFTTLLKAAEATGLTPVLSRPGAITVFAPNDAAFAALPAGKLDELMQQENLPKLQQLLVYHVFNGSLPSSELTGKVGPVPSGIEGKTLQLDGTDAADIKINGADIVQADVRTSNGIVHVVDQVLMPDTPTTTASASTSAADASATAVDEAAATSTAGDASAPATSSATDPTVPATASTADKGMDKKVADSAGWAPQDMTGGTVGASQPSPNNPSPTQPEPENTDVQPNRNSPDPENSGTMGATGAPMSPPASDGAMTSGTMSSGTMSSGTMAAPAPMASGGMAPRTNSAGPDAAAMMKAGDPNVTASAPVPDTAENRAKYGRPQSNAGKRSAAAGN